MSSFDPPALCAHMGQPKPTSPLDPGVTVRRLERRLVIERTRCRFVLQPGRMPQRLAP